MNTEKDLEQNWEQNEFSQNNLQSNISATIKLYDEDAYATEFTAQVLVCKRVCHREKEMYQIILDRTLFFPEEGGQTPDKGTINGMEVLDVQIEDGIIKHYLAIRTEKRNANDFFADVESTKEVKQEDSVISQDAVRKASLEELSKVPHETAECPLSLSSSIKGIINWEHRFSNMQQHSAEHIFSGTVHRKFGYNNVGFHLSDNIVTMDFDGVLSAEQMDEVEWTVNRAITENVEIDARYPAAEELTQMEYRSKIELTEAVRIVTIKGYDVCACCAPHVKRTGEIGIFKIMTVQNYKGGVRISFLCGFRALQAFREKNSVISSLMGCLSTGQETLLERVSKLKDSNQELKIQIGILKQEAMLGKIREIPQEQKQVILFEDELDTAIVRNVVNALVERHDGNCAVFTGNDTEGYQFILGSRTEDCREVAATLRERFFAKCGGSQAMIQGSLKADKERIDTFFRLH